MSIYKVNGIVTNVTSKQIQTKYGLKNVYAVEVGDKVFSTGFKALYTVSEQINVLVEFKYGEYQLVDGTPSNEPELGSEAALEVVAPRPFTPKGGGRGKFPIDPLDGQMSIIRQSSMNRAVDIVDNMVASSVISMLTQDEYMKKILEIAMIVTDFGSGQDIVKFLNGEHNA